MAGRHRFEWMWHFSGSTRTLTPPTYFQRSRPPQPTGSTSPVDANQKFVARSPHTLGLRNENLTWYAVPLVRLLCRMWLLQSIRTRPRNSLWSPSLGSRDVAFAYVQEAVSLNKKVSNITKRSMLHWKVTCKMNYFTCYLCRNSLFSC